MEKIVIQINGEILINASVSLNNVKKIMFGILLHIIVKTEKFLASLMDKSAIMCDEITEETVPRNLIENKANCKTQNFYILLAFLLITIVLLIAVGIYCYLIKYRAKQKNLLPFNFTNKKSKEIY